MAYAFVVVGMVIFFSRRASATDIPNLRRRGGGGGGRLQLRGDHVTICGGKIFFF